MAAGFAARMARDGCAPQLTFQTNPAEQTITGVTLTTTHNNCTAEIPLTVPGSVTDTQDFTTEQLGSDPLTSKSLMFCSHEKNPVLILHDSLGQNVRDSCELHSKRSNSIVDQMMAMSRSHRRC